MSSQYEYNEDDDMLVISDNHSVHSEDTVSSIYSNSNYANTNTNTNKNAKNAEKCNKNQSKLIQCGACFRSFHTQAQFGQHSRICREGKAVIRHLIQSEGYKYAFLEKQTKQKLEVKSRFVIIIAESENWKKISRKSGLYDVGIKKMLESKKIRNVDVAIRQRKASGLIIANFMVRNVLQNAKAIDYAKSSIESAVDIVYNELPNNIEMRLHLCKSDKCKELVIRDTEGFCSRHRAQKYHKKNQHQHQHQHHSSHKNHKNHLNSFAKCNETPPPLCHKIKTKYCQLLNHLKATAPINNNQINQINQLQLQNNINKDVDMNDMNDMNHMITTTEDERIVAQILTDLRASKINNTAPPPVKKRKLDNNNNNNVNNILYMLPVYPMPCIPIPISIPIPMQPVQYAFVPVLPSISINNNNNNNQNQNHNQNNNLFNRSGSLNMNSNELLQLKSLLNSIATNNNIDNQTLFQAINDLNQNNLNISNIPNLPPLSSFTNDNDDNHSQSTDNSVSK